MSLLFALEKVSLWFSRLHRNVFSGLKAKVFNCHFTGKMDNLDPICAYNACMV